MLTVHYGNRIDHLADRLIERLAAPGGAPLETRTVIVPHPAMGRWLARRMAEQCQICANIEFELPAAGLWQAARTGIEDCPARDPLVPDLLAMRVFQIIETAPPKGAEDYVRRLDQRGRWRFARRMAELFNDYALFRPDWILSWDDEASRDWQSRLWRAVVAPGSWHWARLLKTVRSRPAPAGPPLRIFAGSGLAPHWVGLLAHLGQGREVEIDLWTPCREYWGDVRSGRGRRTDEPPPDHGLLGSLGASLRDYFDALLEHEAADVEAFSEEPGGTLLGDLRLGLLNLEESPLAVDPPHAASVQLHGCHSRRREVEVCHDRLLDLFRRTPDLRPDQVQVVMPDLTAYAPLVEAVFGGAPAERRLPYRLLGGLRGFGEVATCVLDLLRLAAGEWRVSGLVDLLSHPGLAARFDLGGSQRDAAIDWLSGSAPLQPPPDSGKFSWDQAMQRLVLSALLDEERVVHGQRRAGVVAAGDEPALSGLLELIERIDAARQRCAEPRPLSVWMQWFGTLPDRFLRLDAARTNDRQSLDQAVGRIRRRCEVTGFDAPVEAVLAIDRLEEELLSMAAGGAGEVGGITVGSAGSLRQMPCRVRYVLGLNDGEFPAARDRDDLDRMQDRPLPGDRSRRDDDRQMMLEWLGTTRDHLVLSYLARDARDDSERPPSTVVDELAECLARCGHVDGSPAVLRRIDHPVQPFSARYGRQPDLITFRSDLVPSSRPSPPLLPPTIPEDSDDEPPDLSELERFYGQPLRHFLSRRLGIRLSEGREVVDDDAPVDVSHLQAFQLRQVSYDGGSSEWLQADVRVPEGPLGRAVADGVVSEAAALAAEVNRRAGGEPLRTLDYELPPTLGLVREGRIGGLVADGRVLLRFGKYRPGMALAAWPAHLVMNLIEPGSTTWLVCRDGTWRLAPPEEPESELEAILTRYRAARLHPLRLLPRSSWTYASTLKKRNDEYAAMAAARRVFEGDRNPERSDPWIALALRDRAELDEEFRDTAVSVCVPLLNLWGKA